MTVKVGQYEFHDVSYVSDRDILDLSIKGLGGVGDEETPEGHVWFVKDDESDEIVALMVVDARRSLERDGAIYVTLPTGERVIAEGAEEALRQAA